MHERTLSFLANWIVANIRHASEPPEADPELLKPRFLTDAVAEGLTLDDVNADWEAVEREIARAVAERRTGL